MFFITNELNKFIHLYMFKLFATLLLVLYFNYVSGQNIRDSCACLPYEKATIFNVDSNTMELSVLKSGFSLSLLDSVMKITNFFNLSYMIETEAGITTSYTFSYQGNQFNPTKHQNMDQHLDLVKRIFIDDIFAGKGDVCFKIKAMSYPVK